MGAKNIDEVYDLNFGLTESALFETKQNLQTKKIICEAVGSEIAEPDTPLGWKLLWWIIDGRAVRSKPEQTRRKIWFRDGLIPERRGFKS